jgi:hypothetical protein
MVESSAVVAGLSSRFWAASGIESHAVLALADPFTLLIVALTVGVGSVDRADWQPRMLSARIPLEEHTKVAR